jgi:hypothetical protein
MPETTRPTPERITEIRDLLVDSCSADAQYNPDVWALEQARVDLLAEVNALSADLDQMRGHITHMRGYHRAHRCEDDECLCDGEADGTKCGHCVQDWPCVTYTVLTRALNGDDRG